MNLLKEENAFSCRKQLNKSSSPNFYDLYFLLLTTSEPKMSQPTNPGCQVFLKTLVNYPAHTVLPQTPKPKMTVEKNLTSHPHNHWAQMKREMTDFSIIFTFESRWVKWERAVRQAGVLETHIKRQHQAGTQWCVWHSDTNTHTQTHTHACTGCVPAPLQTASYRGDN